MMFFGLLFKNQLKVLMKRFKFNSSKSTLLPGSMRVECRPKLSFITCCYIQLVISRNDASQVEKAAKLSALTKKTPDFKGIFPFSKVGHFYELMSGTIFFSVQKYKTLPEKCVNLGSMRMCTFSKTALF